MIIFQQLEQISFTPFTQKKAMMTTKGFSFLRQAFVVVIVFLCDSEKVYFRILNMRYVNSIYSYCFKNIHLKFMLS